MSRASPPLTGLRRVSLFLHWAAASSTVLRILLLLLLIIAATQRLIHPDGAEAVSADRWELILSFSPAVESIVSSLFPPLASTLSSIFFLLLSSGASPNGLWWLHFVSSFTCTHTNWVGLGSLVFLAYLDPACRFLVWPEKSKWPNVFLSPLVDTNCVN